MVHLYQILTKLEQTGTVTYKIVTLKNTLSLICEH